MTCNCISYNAGDAWGGTVPEKILPYRKYFPQSERETVCVDACIADTMERLWAAGVKTGACCCGHNGKSPIANGRPSVMIVDPLQAQLAHDILAADPREWWVQFWAGGGLLDEWQPADTMPSGVVVEISGPRGAITRAKRRSEPVTIYHTGQPRYATHNGRSCVLLRNYNVVLKWRYIPGSAGALAKIAQEE